jgi:GNAT superfamily N-acetyltransferase
VTPGELPVTFEVHDEVPADAGGIVDNGIGAFNDRAAPLRDVVRLSCFARLPSGVVGGAVGRTWGEWCELQQLWVKEEFRLKGIGSALMKRFEARAVQRGCRTFYLETFSFQAPAFYRSFGYSTALEMRGFPGGIVRYTMVKSLQIRTGRTE